MLRTPAPLIGALGFMYKQIRGLNPPDLSSQSLWRYVPSHRLKDILKTNELYFSQITKLVDAREGTLTNRTRDQLAALYQKQQSLTIPQAYDATDEYLKHQERFYVNCWHMNDYESHLMWRAYADRGFAIKTTFERITDAFSSVTGTVYGGVVTYHDFNHDQTSFGNVFRHVVTKDMPYQDEREFRLVFWRLDPNNASLLSESAGIRIPVDVPMLIGSLIRNPFGATIDAELEELIESHKLVVQSSGVAVRRPV